MQLLATAAAFVASLGFIQPGAAANTGDAQQAMESFLNDHPISTHKEVQPKSAPNIAALRAAVLAGNFTPSGPWDFLADPCSWSCSTLGLNSSFWPLHGRLETVAQCEKPMFLDLSLSTPIDNSTRMRGCTANLNTYLNWTVAPNQCPPLPNMINVTSPVNLSWNAGNQSGNATNALAALEQLYAYELMNAAPCNETINFAYSNGIAVGLYTGSGIHRHNLLAPVLRDLVGYIRDEGLPEILVAQRCGSSSARYVMGIFVSGTGDLTAAQAAVQSWRNSSCVGSLEQSKRWLDITFPLPMFSANSTSNSTRQARHVSLSSHSHGYSHSQLHSRDGSTCSTVQVVSGDTCTTLAAECGISGADFMTYNPTLCSTGSTLTVGKHACCSSGVLPDFSPQPDDDGNCYSYQVQKGDSCAALAAEYDLTVDEIDNYNNQTWGWTGCDKILAGANICLSSGWPPMPSIISNAVCGPQVNGTATAPHGTDLSSLNPCPLNACCDIWGQCGITADFCTPTNSTTGAPGTAAEGTNGCISNCGTDIIQSGAPAEAFTIGYFEGYDLSRPCMRTRITDIDLSSYTHIHMSFATLNSDFSFNISTIEEQMTDFAALDNVKRVITIGGWDFSTDVGTYTIFRNAMSTSTNRQALVSSTIAFLQEYDLDGVDWDWEYPGEPDIPGIPADSDQSATNFYLFLLELSAAMEVQTPAKTLSTTAPSSYWYMKQIPIEAISEVVDYIVMMTYDMHGQWDWNNTSVDSGCPGGNCLRSHVNLTETLSAMSMITKAGVPSNKVVLGVSSYARSFQMTEAGCYTEMCTYTGPDSGAVPGKCTQTAGYISNAELAGIAAEEEVYTYIDEVSNSNIMVWNETQWAAYMDDAVKASRAQLYGSLDFLGIADWAIDLQMANDTTGNSSSATDASSSTIYIDPTVWVEASPSVTAADGVTLIWPPLPLTTTTTITFPGWPTHITYTSTETKTLTLPNNSTVPYRSYSEIPVPTVLSIEPVTTDAIPVWYQQPTSGQSVFFQTSSVLQTPFPVVFTP
jgi:chitinase